MPPTTGIIDSFNRANETPLASPWAPLFPGETAANLASNVAQAANGVEQVGVHTTTVFPANQEVYFTIPATTTGRYLYLEARVTNHNTSSVTCYQLEIPTGGGVGTTWTLAKVVNNSGTSLTTASQSIAAGDLFRLKLTNSEILATRTAGGTETTIINTTDTAITGGGYIGMGLLGNGTGLTVDDFGGGSTKPAPVPNISRAAVQRAARI